MITTSTTTKTKTTTITTTILEYIMCAHLFHTDDKHYNHVSKLPFLQKQLKTDEDEISICRVTLSLLTNSIKHTWHICSI